MPRPGLPAQSLLALSLLALSLVAAVLVALAPPARAAQDAPRLLVAVREADERRQRYEAQGAHLGAVLVNARIEERLTWDDNVFAEANGGASDFIATTGAALSLRRQGPWNLAVTAAADLARHAEQTALDHENYRVGASVAGRSWDRSRLDLSAAYRHLHEQPGDPDLTGAAAEPVPVDRLEGEGDLLLRRGLFFVGAEAAVRRFDFHDVPSRQGEVLNQDSRDRWAATSALRLGVAPTATVDVFAEHRLENVAHEDTAAFSRDWSTRLLLGGIAVDFSERLVGEVAAGTMTVRWSEPGADDLTKPVVRAAFAFGVTPLVTAHGRVWRAVEASPNLAGFGVLADGAGLRLDHELLRNLLLSVEAEVTRRAWQGPGATRRDERVRFGVAVDWRLDSRWYAGVRLARERRFSTEPEAAFDRARVVLRFGARL